MHTMCHCDSHEGTSGGFYKDLLGFEWHDPPDNSCSNDYVSWQVLDAFNLNSNAEFALNMGFPNYTWPVTRP